MTDNSVNTAQTTASTVQDTDKLETSLVPAFGVSQFLSLDKTIFFQTPFNTFNDLAIE